MAPYPVHLLTVCHGLWGSPSHIGYICQSVASHAHRAAAASPDGQGVKLVVLPAQTMEWVRTYDGIDLNAERVVIEIDEEIAKIEKDGGKVVSFSIVGYSLGGLIARYVLGLLESRTPSFFSEIKPVNFTTFASPAIGIPEYNSFWSSVFRFLGARLLSRSGSQLYENDRYLVESSLLKGNNQEMPKGMLSKLTRKKEKAQPLLSVMADPQYSFFKALSAFEKIDIYANTVNDRTVPFPTGAIEAHDPFAEARAKAQKVAEARDDDPALPVDLRNGGMDIQLEKDAAILVSWDPIPPPSPSSTHSAHKKPRRWVPRLPLLLRPTTYPFSRPVSLVIIVTLPISLPLALMYLIGRFVVQSQSSRRRIKDMRKVMGGGREGMLERVGVKLREVVETVGAGDNPEYAAGLNPPSSDSSGSQTPVDGSGQQDEYEDPKLRHHPAFQALSSYDGVDTPPLSRPLFPQSFDSDGKPLPTDPLLSPAQLKMIENLNSIPQMKKHFVYLPQSRNAHGAIVARDHVRFAQHVLGKKIVDRWAEEFKL